MTERDTYPEPPKPPKRWHDAVRRLPGNMEDEQKFVTYPEVTDEGIVFSFISLTQNDSRTGLPEGIYINTSLILGSTLDYAAPMTPIMFKIKEIISSEPGEREEVPMQPDMDQNLAELGAMVNLANTIGFRVAALTKNKMMIFGIQPVKIDDLKGSTRIA